MGKCARSASTPHDRERRRLRWAKRRLWPGEHRTGFRCRSIRATMTAMSVVAARSPIAKPDVPDLLARARTIASLARERAQQTEVDRRVGEDMIARMRELDLFRIMRPQAYGGFEYGFDVFSDIVAAVCERLRLDRLGLWPARLAPVAYRLPGARGAGRGLARPQRARDRQLRPGRTGGGGGRRLPALRAPAASAAAATTRSGSSSAA